MCHCCNYCHCHYNPHVLHAHTRPFAHAHVRTHTNAHAHAPTFTNMHVCTHMHVYYMQVKNLEIMKPWEVSHPDQTRNCLLVPGNCLLLLLL